MHRLICLLITIRKFLIVVGDNLHRGPQLEKVQILKEFEMLSPKLDNNITSPPHKPQGLLWKRGQKLWMSVAEDEHKKSCSVAVGDKLHI